VLVALPRAPREAPQSRYSENGATPGPIAPGDAVRGPDPRPVGGDAPWALSALPECFHQVHFASGDAAFVGSKMPPGSRAVAAGATLATADCRLRVGVGDATVARGDNLLRVPPPARFFVAGDRLLLRTRAGARITLRTYAIVAGGAPRFVAGPP